MVNNTKLTVACIQNNSSNSLDDNLDNMRAMLLEACTKGADFIALPECAFFMASSDDAEPEPYRDTEHPGITLCQNIATENNVWILVGSISVPIVTSVKSDKKSKWYNRSILIDNRGQIVARYNKIHLFDAALDEGEAYKESCRFRAGEHLVVADTKWGKLGMAICYDLRFPHLHREMAKMGAKMITIPAAFVEYTGKAHWHVLLRARAIETGCFIIAPDQCGHRPSGKKMYGHSLIINPWGEVIAEGDAEEPCVITAEIDLADVAEIRKRLPSIHHDRDYYIPPEYNI